MKVIVDNFGNKFMYDSLERYAEDKLDGDSYGSGVLDAANQTAKNNSAAIGRLLDALAEKSIIDTSDIIKVIEGYYNDSVTFELDE